MSKLRVHCFGVSLDGFGAGPNQDMNNPLGVGGEDLHQWLFPTRTFQKMQGKEDGTTGVDNDFAERGFDRIGAWILGRNMFGPVRGPWPDDKWKGWWGDDPPYHTQVFVLTHYPRSPIQMNGGTTFQFCHRRHSRGAATRPRGGEWIGCAVGRRGRDHPAVSAGRIDRRTASRHYTGCSRHRRKPPGVASTF